MNFKMRIFTLLLLFVLIGLFAFTNHTGRLVIDPDPVIQQFQDWLSENAEYHQAEKVYVQMDRTLYRPGESLWFTAFLRNAYDLSLSETSGVLYVEVLDAKGVVKLNQKHEIPRGTTNGVFVLPKDWPGGVYTLKAYSRWMQNDSTAYTKTFQIQRAVVPNLSMKLDFARKGYGPGEQVEALLRVTNLEDQPLRLATIQVSVLSQGKKLHTWEDKLDFDGTANVNVDLPDTILNDALLSIQIPYLGQQEQISRSIPLATKRIQLDFLPEGGHLVAGLASSVAFKAVDLFWETY